MKNSEGKDTSWGRKQGDIVRKFISEKVKFEVPCDIQCTSPETGLTQERSNLGKKI